LETTVAEPSKTLISSHAAFAAGADLVEYRDWRQIGDLIRDNDTRPEDKATVIAEIDTVGSAGWRALRGASAEIETACYRGGRYTRADLQGLLAVVSDADGSGLTVAGQLLVQLTCDLAYWTLAKRRYPTADPRKTSGVIEAMAKLEALRLGEAIFPFTEVGAAAVMDIAPLDPAVDKNVYRLEPLSTTAVRLFGVRSRDLR
jgi:phage gp36-like protein